MAERSSARPAISVLTATYNGAETCRRTVEAMSALERPSVEAEYVMVDNNSTDDTRNVVEGYHPKEALPHFEGECVLGTAQWLPSEDGEFDTVVCADVLEHETEEDMSQGVRELGRVPARQVLIGVPCRRDLRPDMIGCSACGCRYHMDRHMQSFSGPKAIERRFLAFEHKAVVLLDRPYEIPTRAYRWLRYGSLGAEADAPFAARPDCSCTQNPAWQLRRLRAHLMGVGWDRLANGQTPTLPLHARPTRKVWLDKRLAARCPGGDRECGETTRHD